MSEQLKDNVLTFIPNHFFTQETKKELAFESDGVKYYHFTDGGAPIYIRRFQAFQDKMSKAEEWKISDAVLSEYMDMVEKYTMDGGNISAERKLAEIARLTDNMKWRRRQNNDMQIVFELASVWYFDQTEDPAEYNESYAREKIKRWQGDRELFSFFLRTPLNKYIGFSEPSESGTRNYLRAMYSAVLEQSLNNLSRLSKSETESEIGQNILLLVETYRAMINLIDLESESISTS